MGKLHLIPTTVNRNLKGASPHNISQGKYTEELFVRAKLWRSDYDQVHESCCPSPIFKPGNLRCLKFDPMLSWLSPTKAVKGDPRGLQCMSIFPSPHPLSSRKLKKSPKLPSHRYLPTPTTFHFLPPPYIFAPISSSSLLCTSSLLILVKFSSVSIQSVNLPIHFSLLIYRFVPQNVAHKFCLSGVA